MLHLLWWWLFWKWSLLGYKKVRKIIIFTCSCVWFDKKNHCAWYKALTSIGILMTTYNEIHMEYALGMTICYNNNYCRL